MVYVGSDFSGVGAFNQALRRLKIQYSELFACDMDKYARQTFELNYGIPKDFPTDVYDREIPKQSLDIYMTSPPCQAFSMAGKRLGKEDKRGILFFNSLEFIQVNKPRYFIFENVKGLLSHDKVDPKADYGRTFQEWVNYLGGKSVNGVHTFFPIEDSVPYHIYFQVLNAKHYGIPQNRERIFIIGIRDDEDNNFQFPREVPLTKRLKDVLESEVDEKYFLGEKTLEYFQKHLEHHQERGNGFGFKPQELSDSHANSLTTKYGSRQSDTYLKIGTWRTHEDGKGFRATEDNNCPTIPARAREDGSGQPVVKIGAIRGRNPENPKSREAGLEMEQMLEINENGTSNALTTVQKDNVVVMQTKQLSKQQLEKLNNLEVDENIAGCITEAIGRAGSSDEYISSVKRNAIITQRIRRLTPLECFRLMDFNFGIENVPDFKWNVSDSQAYKQAGNSICVGVLAAIISRLKL